MKSPFDAEVRRSLLERHRAKLFFAQGIAFILLGIFIAALFWRTPTPEAEGLVESPTAVAAAETLWTCSMHPQIRQPKPGKCPICGMDLIPVARTTGGLRTLALSPEAESLMQIETTPVERRYVTHEIPMVGRVDFDETRLGYITAWVAGRLDRLYVDFTGVQVERGDHLAYIYSEQLYTAQEELIQALKNRRSRPPQTTTLIQPIDLVESAREKLRLLGLKEEQIAAIEKQGEPSDHMTIYSPLGGIVIQKLKQQGDRVQLGERIYTIADLSLVWVDLDAYESDLPWVRYGQDVAITTEAYPGEEFHGRIAFIQPVLNDKTRTVKVRVNVPNPDGKLKPEMFVHAVVRPRVASGGKVMDPSLAGKWISPMHPEIVKDAPGTCDICGMPLVRAESLGYVAPSSDQQAPPLVVPYSAVLVTGTRAIVYVQLPNMASFAEPAIQTLAAVIEAGDLEKAHDAFATYGNMLDRPYDQPGTDYARNLWNDYADSLSQLALAGQRAASMQEAEQVFAKIESTMNHAREEFAPPERPTFEGREILLGPRAGQYYLVRNGLLEGEMVVTQGNFKIDAEIQIQAKPSMMTPEGGGGGGHHHGGPDTTAKKSPGEDHSQHAATLPVGFTRQVRQLDAAYEQISAAIAQKDLGQITAGFNDFGKVLNSIDENLLTGHPRMLWKEFSMLLGNDAVEGSQIETLPEADRVFLVLKGHMRRMRGQMSLPDSNQPLPIQRIAVPQQFQFDLARVWEKYLAVSQALSNDNMPETDEYLIPLETTVVTVNADELNDEAKQAWARERKNLEKLISQLRSAQDIKTVRAAFLPLSQEIGVLAKTFGFGEPGPIFEVHCPMAFQGKGAVWYQDNEQVRNPYFGSTMLKCADRVEKVVNDEPAPPAATSNGPHSGHQGH